MDIKPETRPLSEGDVVFWGALSSFLSHRETNGFSKFSQTPKIVSFFYTASQIQESCSENYKPDVLSSEIKTERRSQEFLTAIVGINYFLACLQKGLLS